MQPLRLGPYLEGDVQRSAHAAEELDDRRPVRLQHAPGERLVSAGGVILLAGCLFGTDPAPVVVQINEPELTSAERAAWPTDPLVESGRALIVRAKVSVACRGLAATAEREGLRVTLKLFLARPDVGCVQIVYPPQPFEIELVGLPVGSYDLRIEMVGREEPFQRKGDVLRT